MVEYKALSSIVIELLCFSYFLRDFQIKKNEPKPLYFDNKSSIQA